VGGKLSRALCVSLSIRTPPKGTPREQDEEELLTGGRLRVRGVSFEGLRTSGKRSRFFNEKEPWIHSTHSIFVSRI